MNNKVAYESWNPNVYYKASLVTSDEQSNDETKIPTTQVNADFHNIRDILATKNYITWSEKTCNATQSSYYNMDKNPGQ